MRTETGVETPASDGEAAGAPTVLAGTGSTSAGAYFPIIFKLYSSSSVAFAGQPGPDEVAVPAVALGMGSSRVPLANLQAPYPQNS
ncbi:hypothetical protein DL766_007781 [Monosporascus sp. MC13-8B]|uniref:Uncharacterized protein n=1 Tax=Monosporascus cannonballus TaxID=155416 RepID=A0ABY0H5T4_9PEZI|nr:hypothetical protein DL762_006625 [Monosporascus cannonballus]RYO87973.1 hypothetical protein DL763_006175 [Monosporascus cannonballus]RYP22081.1 hypothetical protein DL766_007781 [Monosporascus sp. MC13-8B]